MKNLDRAIMLIFFGFTIAALLSLSIKYPLKIEKIDQYKSFCTGSTISTVYIGIDGVIHKVKCTNGKELTVPYEP